MAISIPWEFQLNFMGLDALNDELTKWETKAKTLYGNDLAKATTYIEAVRAERDQRAESYKGGTLGAALAGFTSVFEGLGGSTGAGASGALGTTSSALGEGASALASTAKTYSYVIIGGIFILAGFGLWLYIRKR